MHPLAQEFMAVFEGYTKSYGAYKLTGEVTETGKVVGKAYTLKGDVSVELWSKHLSGEQGLGVVPITEQSKVKFAAIDIDEYPLDLTGLNQKLQDNQIPLVLFRTKSGGAHLYLFLTDWVSAKIVIQKMREIAAFLGYGNSEIFPKQSQILAERGDVGQWINMPYFGGDATERYAFNSDNEKIPANRLAKYVFDHAISPDEMAMIKLSPNEETSPLHEAPPCLSHLCTQGFPAGTRNTGLFNLGVYARMFNPDNWVALLDEYNNKFMSPPLTSSEVQGVVKSLSKDKDYSYTCKAQPICSVCNKNVCRNKKFGIGVSGVGVPKTGTLCKIDTKPPIWFVDVEGGGRLELDTQELLYPRAFAVKCMEATNILPPLIKQDLWSEMVQKLLADVTIVEVPVEATPKGQLRAHLEDFCTSRVQAKCPDEMLMGKPYLCDGYHYFRMKDFQAYLARHKFKEFELNRIAVYLRDWGAKKHFFNCKGKGINCYVMPEFKPQDSPFDLPTELTKAEKPY